MALKVTTDSSGKITGATDSSGSYSVSPTGTTTKISSPTTTTKTTTKKTSSSSSGYAAPSNTAITGRFMDGSGFDDAGNYYDPAGVKTEMGQVAGEKYTDNGVVYTAPSRSVAVKPPSVISSSDGAALTQQNQATLDRYSTSGLAAGTKVTTPTTTTTKPGVLDTTMGKPTDPKTGLVGNAALLYKQTEDLQKTSDSLMKTYQTSLANYAKTLDKNTQDLVASIESQFAIRKSAQEELNRATLGGLEIAGARSGRLRYANEMQTNLMSSAEASGIAKLAELDVQEKGLIIQARAANDEKKFGLLDKSITALMENAKQKQATIFQLYQFSQQEEQIAMTKLRDAYDQMNSDRNFDLQTKQFQLTQQKAAQEFAASNGITGQFYMVGNTAIDTRTGEAVDLAKYQELTGQVGKSEAETDFSKIQNLSAAQEAKYIKDTTRAVVASLAEKYFDAGVLPTDSIEAAQAKITRTSRIYAEQVRPPSSGGGNGSIPAATKAAMIGSAKQALLDSRGKDQHYDPYTYLNLRQDYAAITGETADFDNAYAPGLSATERVNLGLGKAPSLPNYLTTGGAAGDYSWLDE